MATYKLYKKTSATAKEEIQIPASSVSGLANVATSGSYNDLSNKPPIPTNYVTTDTDQEITGKKTFKHKDGIFIDRIHNLSGNAVYDYDGTNVRFGSVSKPAHIRGSEARPKYESPSGDGSGSTVKKDIALVDDLSNGSVKSVIDYNDNTKKIKIGYSGAGITGDNIKYIAGFTTGDSESVAKIKDISKDALKSWIGLAAVATSGSYNDLSNKPTIPDVSGKLDKSAFSLSGTTLTITL